MDISSVLKKAGGSILKNAFPPFSGVAFDLINDVLPSDKRLSESSTGADAEKAIASLPPEQRISLLEKKLDVEIEEIKGWTNVVSALAEVDKTGHTTRPKIAREQSVLIGFGVVVTLSSVGYAIITSDSEMIDSIAKAWPLILAVIGVPAGIVNSYFGKRTKEKAQKYEGVTNTPPVTGIISQILGAFKK
ncbi:MAG: hypothetical protein U9Q18_04080 [Caldisericota bacterium]|nr:hypothetical protein [Caldisericota bacterium]